MEYTSRAEWGARKPTSRLMTTWSARTHFGLHYSAASPDQTPREIQNFHMDTRGWSDIGYNWLVHSVTGEIFEGRGWLVVGAHIAGYNTPTVGVCVIGRDVAGRQDVSEAARRSVRILWAEAERLKAGPLMPIGHRDRAATTCPGDELYGWLRAGMPLATPAPTPAPFLFFDQNGDDTMPYALIRHADKDKPAVFALFGSGAVRHIGRAELQLLMGVTSAAHKMVVTTTTDDAEYTRLVAAARIFG